MRVIRALKWALFLTCLGWAGYSARGVFVISELSRALDHASPNFPRPEASGLQNLCAGLQLLAVIAGPALVSGSLLLIKRREDEGPQRPPAVRKGQADVR